MRSAARVGLSTCLVLSSLAPGAEAFVASGAQGSSAPKLLSSKSLSSQSLVLRPQRLAVGGGGLRGRAAVGLMGLTAVVEGVTGNVGEAIADRQNAHMAGLLQNPYDASGSSGAFPGLPEHTDKVGVASWAKELDPWGSGGFPEGCVEDPFALVKEELSPFSESIKAVVDTEHPVLSDAAKHFFAKAQGKRFRPTIVMLMAKAVAEEPSAHLSGEVYDKQALLGQITEMIHVASLIHDDVLDEADTRRGGEAVHKLYDNKVAVIAGDYLLARASVVLARLQNTAVTAIMSTALESLVQGEIMQIKTNEEDLLDMMTYLRKSYHKTASLICDACKSCAILGGYDAQSEVAMAAEEYGYHLGLAYQIIDDVLDFTSASDVLGKPALADVSLGLSTAPVLYASEDIPDLKPMIKRKFKQEGDVEKTLQYVLNSNGVERARQLALFHAQTAVNAICKIPESKERNALVSLAHIVLSRKS